MKKILFLLILSVAAWSAWAQAKYDLGYDPATETYTVSLIPEVTWSGAKNMVGSAQIVLRVASDKDFTPAITSQIDGLIWVDNAYVENPDGAPGHTFVCISLVNGPTAKIQMADGQKQPLFSFINAGGACAGPVTMLENTDPMVKAVRLSGYNVTQHLAMIGARGNAIEGVENHEVDCSLVSNTIDPGVRVIGNVQVMPVPADHTVTVRWSLLHEQPDNKYMVIYDSRGREVFREKISDNEGNYTQTIKVENWQSGMYQIRFLLGQNHQTQSWNMMVLH